MKISVDWLNSYLDTPVSADEIDRVLTDQGLPIESRCPVGDPADDTLLDVEVTSNRADCLSHVGLARDVAAGLGCSLILPDCSVNGLDSTGAQATAGCAITIANEEHALCPLYSARVIRRVTVGPSPAWLVRRLASVGLRSVNNVVDITNFVLLELGQPLHAFDLDRLDGPRVTVRKARQNESIVAIDGTVCKLDSGTLVIADNSRPIAIAGVMGGAETGVTDQTQNVLLESALFDAVAVRRASRSLKLVSDSSFRFERGVDPMGVDAASCRAARLVCELAGGQLSGEVIRVGQPPSSPLKVVMRPERCNRLLGVRLAPGRMVQLLDRLGFAPSLDDRADQITCTVPSRRTDVQREVDLIEEVVRLHGFDAIPVHEKIHIVTRPRQRAVEARRRLNQVLVAHGYHETITFSFVNRRLGEPFVPLDHRPVMIDDPHRQADTMLRPSILPSLMICRKSNQDVGNTGVRLYECAATWTRDPERLVETNRLGVLCDADDAQLDLRRLRGSIGELVGELVGSESLEFVPEDVTNFAPGAAVVLNGKRIGYAGLVDASCQALFQLQTRAVAAELEWDTLLNNNTASGKIEPLPKFPGIGRDLSIVVDESVRWSEIHQHVMATQPNLMEQLVFLGVYRGKPIPSGKKSVSFRLHFRDPSATLRHEQVDGQIAAVVERLQTQLHAQLRA